MIGSGGSGPHRWDASALAAAAALLLGFAVILGRILGIPAVVQILPSFVPMQFNTALGFALSGAALLLLRSRPRAAAALGALTATLGLFTLAEYLFDGDFGIDEFFITHTILVQTSPAGRMAPGTALSFLLVGGGTALLTTSRRAASFAAGLFAAIAVALGALALVGCAGSVEAACGWGRYTWMAVHTAAGFVLSGSSLFLLFWGKGPVAAAARPRWLAGLMGAGVLVASVGVWQALLAHELDSFRRLVASDADQIAARIRIRLDNRLGSIGRLAGRWEVRGGTPRGEWEADAGAVARDEPGYQAIERIDADGRVRWIVPLPGNEAALGTDLTRDPALRKALLAAARDRAIRASLPVDLAERGRAVFAFAPTFPSGAFDGYVLGVFRADDLLTALSPGKERPGYCVRITVGATLVGEEILDEELLDPDWTQERDLEFAGLRWQLRCTPTLRLRNENRHSFPLLALLLGAMFALALGGTAYFGGMARLRAAREADTRELLDAVNRVLAEAVRGDTAKDVAQAGLDVAMALTGSAFGFVGGRNEHGTCDILVQGGPAGEAARILGDEQVRRLGDRVIRDGRALSTDGSEDPAPPAGFLGVPLVRGKTTFGVMALADPPGGFRDADRERLEALSVALAQALDRKRADVALARERAAALEMSEERFRATFDQAAVGMAHVSPEGRFLRLNRRFCEIAGRTTEEILAATFQEITHPDDLDKDLGLVRQVLAGEIPTYTTDKRYLRPDGSEVWIRLTVSLVRTVEGKPKFFISVIQDIDEEVRAETELARHRERLEEMVRERTEEMEAFTYSVSHDLRAPLRAIDGFSRIVEEEYGPRLDDEGRRLLGVVRENSRQMGELIDGLLALSRLGRMDLRVEEIDMSALTAEVVGRLRAEEPGRRVDFRIGEMPPARGDRSMVRQVLANLIENAVKFSAERETPVVEISGEASGEEGSYRVRDNGAGFEPEYADKLFTVFQRLHKRDRFAGTGIGLATVKRIVLRHGGSVRAEGRPEEGATFIFTLPENNGGPK